MSSTVSETTDVVIVGAGPVGLMLAGELCLAGVRPVVVERLPERNPVPRANGLVGQVVRLMDHRGLYQRLSGVDEPPRPTPWYMFGGMPLPLGDWADNPLFAFPIPQWDLEVGLEARALELGADVRRGEELFGFTQDADGVTVELSTGTLRARYLVGCDGGHSQVRKLAGIDFAGVSSDEVVSHSAHVVLPDSVLREGAVQLPVGCFEPVTFYRTDHGVFVFASFQPGVHLVTAMEWGRPPVPDDQPATLEDVRAAVARVLGTDLPMSLPQGPGRYVLRRLSGRNTRLADRYRVGRVLVAGDAAHVHSAVGGPGLNVGLQDVANLGWKLAATVQGWAPEGLLDTYHGERHPVGERVMMHTQAQSALLAPGGEVTAVRAVFGELLADQANVRRIAAMMAGSDVHYTGGGDADPLLGRWVVDFPLTVAGRVTRLAELARTGRPLLLDLTGRGELADVAAGWVDRVDRVVAESDAAPAEAILVRPDGYAAWVGGGVDSLADALRAWFGEPVAVAAA